MTRNNRRIKTMFMCLALAGASSSCDGSLALSGDRPGSGPNNNATTGDPTSPSATLHRLNRLEYNNSVRDLLGTRLQPANAFPPDSALDGFDNAAAALTMSPALLDRYFEAARLVVDDAFADRPVFSDQLEEDDPRLTYSIDRDANRIGGIVRLRGGSAQGAVQTSHTGTYTLTIRCQGYVNGTAAAPRVRVNLADQVYEFDAPTTMGDVSWTFELPAGTHTVGFSAINFEENAAENRGNDVMVDVLRLSSQELVPGPARDLILTCDPSVSVACATNILETFAYRAWRRPLTDGEKQTLADLLTTFQANGESIEEAVKLGLRAVLVSPKFLYRYRTLQDSNAAQLVDPFVLATRLSFFIWSSTPDERLLQAAATGELGTADGIRQTVAWMLADSRSEALAEGFAAQWLDLRHLEQVNPSREVYPEFNEGVRESMVRESTLFFLDFVERPQPVADMLAPSFAYRDATLAGHLGLALPTDDGFSRVPVVAGDRRGVLALSAWLTARSDSTHSSPIKRGSWVADNMLCAPVPPPPAGLVIGQLPDESSGQTVRQRLEQHRNDPACATCHTHLDVLGMGFEAYDGVGRWLPDPTIDSTGQVPGAGQFRGADELAAQVAPPDFVMCVSRKLFTYALGRAVDSEDLVELKKLTDAELLTVSLADLITTIVLSPAFSAPSPLE